MREIPKPFEIYKHFKGMLYQIQGIAKHSETGEAMVVYQQLYAPFGLYVRPLSMFLSEVDHEKYPSVTQKYRFEKIQAPAFEITVGEGVEESNEVKKVEVKKEEIRKEEVKNEPQIEMTQASENPELELLEPFLDADTYEEKLEILAMLKPSLTDSMIDTMAVCLDVEVKPGDLEARYAELKNCLLTMEHFECNRLR